MSIFYHKPRRRIERVFIHCSAADWIVTTAKLKQKIHHIHVIENGWSDIGYHYLINKTGETVEARPLEANPAAQRGHNKRTIAIMVHGLADFPVEALNACKWLCEQINVAHWGRISFHGHCEVSAKSCPVFDYKAVLSLDRFGRMP